MNPRDIVIRLATALVIAAIIGVERQWRQRMAGLRTNALVSIGAAGFVVFSTTASGDNTTVVAAQIVSGIGFLGAGVILREGINVRGLNTAATLWCSAMVGTFAGAGQLLASVLAGAFVVGTNLFPAAPRAPHQSATAGRGRGRNPVRGGTAMPRSTGGACTRPVAPGSVERGSRPPPPNQREPRRFAAGHGQRPSRLGHPKRCCARTDYRPNEP
jgi:hypothetical protein